MAPRGRYSSHRDDVDHSYESSPDPLVMSSNENTARSARTTSRKEPLRMTSPSKQNRRTSISEMQFSSPSKSMVVSTPRMGNASPWRIKVTVQAEPESDEENASPSVKRVTRTKTTTVPLKDPDAQTPIKRGRGRPRKSDIGVATTKTKRSGTPAKGKRTARSKSRDKVADNMEPSAADVETDVPQKKRRGRPRKSIQPAPPDDTTPQVGPTRETSIHDMEDMSIAVSDHAASLSPPPSRSISGSPDPLETFAGVPQSTPSPADEHRTLQEESRDGEALSDYQHIQIPIAENASSPASNDHTFRRRKGTPHLKKIVPVEVISDEEMEDEDELMTPSSDDEGGELGEQMYPSYSESANAIAPTATEVSTVVTDRLTMPLDEPLRSAGDVAQDIERERSMQAIYQEEEDLHDETNFALDEGATRMPDDTTIIDSENFSMISVDSLRSGPFSSPPKPEELQSTKMATIASVLSNDSSSSSAHHSMEIAENSNALQVPGAEPTGSGRGPRYKTPVVDNDIPNDPPAIEPVPESAPKSATPRLGRVVTAGVALQGVLDPARLTPQPSQKALDEKRDRLDDLFRGFSEGTRRELQAGLRLGEQLADNQSRDQSPAPRSSPTKEIESGPKRGPVFRTHRKYQQTRLPTPEEQDHQVNTTSSEEIARNDAVQYPALDVVEAEHTLLSPDRSEDEMSWRVDTPPVTVAQAHQPLPQPQVAVVTNEQKETENYADIWQEEASRSSNSAEDNLPENQAPAHEDIFIEGEPARPARGKLPRTWRRKTSNHFHYSDEAESPQQAMNEEPVTEAVEEDEDDVASEASDDTGMFFQANIPNVYNKRAGSRRQGKSEKLDLSLLLNEGQSLVPDSSPPVVANTQRATNETNPFLDTPPRFTGFINSPTKSSPLRQELRGSDISSESIRPREDESTLPVPQSSPFHTFVDGEVSLTSDQRQFRVEMEGSTASSIRRVRAEANEYLDAYEPQERSLNEITEVTEPSRTWHERSVMASSPPRRQQSFAQSMISPVRRVPLFDNAPTLSHRPSARQNDIRGEDSAQFAPEGSSSSSADAMTPESEVEPQQSGQGLFTRVTSGLIGAFGRPTSEPAPAAAAAPSTPPRSPHPYLSRCTRLPKVEPWTKTHYKTLDKLYQTHLKHPALFSPSITPATRLSETNTELLSGFLATTKQPYVGAKFSAWGYTMEMTEELVVLCAVYTQILSLDSVADYESSTGRKISMGDCGPGKAGDAITGEEVARRLATVVMGEEVRRDEKAGLKIDRSRALSVVWPQ